MSDGWLVAPALDAVLGSVCSADYVPTMQPAWTPAPHETWCADPLIPRVARVRGGGRVGSLVFRVWRLHADGARRWTLTFRDARGPLDLGRASWSTHSSGAILLLVTIVDGDALRRVGHFGVVQTFVCEDGVLERVAEIAVPGDVAARPFLPPEPGWIGGDRCSGGWLTVLSWNGALSDGVAERQLRSERMYTTTYSAPSEVMEHLRELEDMRVSRWPNAVVVAELESSPQEEPK